MILRYKIYFFLLGYAPARGVLGRVCGARKSYEQAQTAIGDGNSPDPTMVFEDWVIPTSLLSSGIAHAYGAIPNYAYS